MTLLVNVVSSIATCTGFVLFLGPAPDARAMLHTRSTGVTPLVPLVSMFSCAWVWSIYGLLHSDIFPLMVTNLIGLTFSSVYTSIFYRFTTDKGYAHKVFAGFGAVLALVTAYAILGYYGYTHQSRASVTNVMGYIGNAIIFIFLAAPFENIAQVFRHRSGVFIPIKIVVATFLNAIAWLVYGLLTSDWLIVIPQIGALVVGSCQIAVYVYFHPSTHPLPAPEAGTSPSINDAKASNYVGVVSPVEGMV